MTGAIRKLGDLLDRREKVRAVFFAVGTVAVGVLEMASVAAVPVFVAVMSDPQAVEKHALLRAAFGWVGANTAVGRLAWVGGAVGLLYLVRTVVCLTFLGWQSRFVFNIQERLTVTLFAAYLNAPYTFHLRRNPTQLMDHVLAVPYFVQSGLLTAMRLLMEVLVLVSILALLVWVEPLAMLGTAAVLGGASAGLAWIIRRKLDRLANEEFRYRQEMIRTVNSGLAGIKEATAFERRDFFRRAFDRHLRLHTRAGRFRTVVGEFPRSALETLAVLGMLAVTALLLLQGRPMARVIPTLTLVAAGALRIVPSLNRLVTMVTGIGWTLPSLNAVHADLAELGVTGRGRSAAKDWEPAGRLAGVPTAAQASAGPDSEVARGVLELRNVCYRYPGTADDVLRGVSLAVPEGTSVALVGRSGTGKTTLVDIVLGLLPPTEGKIFYDGDDIGGDLGRWRRRVGYIPQAVYLSDDTVRQNICFGLEPHEIDDDRVWDAVRHAQLEELIEKLPDGLDTVVGERGVRLSGGQRQRIGIARALYHRPAVLVMDEATSALDNETERLIVETFDGLREGRTLIVIAHRISTVRRCDQIYLMEDGRLAAQGTYTRLLKESASFNRLVRLGQEVP